jgi:hypothetical protein
LNKRNFDRYQYQLPALLWAIFIFVLCMADVEGIGFPPLLGFLPFDKVAHFVLFGILLFLVLLRNYHTNISTLLFDRRKIFLLTLVLAYAAFIEIYQQCFTSNRQGDWWDFAAGGAGALTVVLLLHFLKRIRQIP